MRAGSPCRIRVVAGLVAAAGTTASSVASLPPLTVDVLYRQGEFVQELGQINSPFFFSSGGVTGATSFVGLAVNNSGDAFVVANIYALEPLNQAVLRGVDGLVPYIGSGLLFGVDGALSLPTADYAARNFYAVDVDNSGSLATTLRMGEGDGGLPVPFTSGVARAKLALVAQQGGTITAAGVAPGTTFGGFSSTTVLCVAGNLYLIGTTIIEGGISRRALLKVQTDAAGSVLSQSVVAKEGGLVGAGPSTWSTLSIGANTAAMNDAGTVAFSAITSAGVEGVFRDSVAIATRGGPAPGAGNSWGELLGAPLDINNSGNVAFRALFGAGTWTEVGDAGETYAAAQQTTDGSLSTIVGTLSDSHDVDVYRIRISNPAAFSATTVPAPGFPGAAGDTVLYLLRNHSNFNGITRQALARSDDAAPGVPQSTLTSANLPPDVATAANQYHLVIATPKSRPIATSGEFWLEDPGSIAVAGGRVYWCDSSDGVLRRLNATTGAEEAVYPLSPAPGPYAGQITGTGKFLQPAVAAYESAGQTLCYWVTDAYNDDRVQRGDPFAFTPTDVATVSVDATSGLAVDAVNGRIFWCRPGAGEVRIANLDGSDAAALVAEPGTIRPQAIAADPPGQMIYWSDRTAGTIQRANYDGSPVTVQTIVSVAGPGGVAVDSAAGKVYWSVPAGGMIERANLDGTGRETFKSGLGIGTLTHTGAGLAIDSGVLYHCDVPQRRILTMSLGFLEPSATVLSTLPARIGDTACESPSRLDAFTGWVKDGVATGPAMPYQIQLTGVDAFNQQAQVVVNNSTRIATTGEAFAATGGEPLLSVGSQTGPIRISDNNLVAYRATWGAPVVTGLMLGQDVVMTNLTAPADNAGEPLGAVDAGPHGWDMSDNGQHLIMYTGRSLPNFTAAYRATKFSFDEVPGACAADFNGVNGVTVQDIYDFLAAWSASDPSADFNGVNGVTVQDIYDFLAAWSAGC